MTNNIDVSDSIYGDVEVIVRNKESGKEIETKFKNAITEEGWRHKLLSGSCHPFHDFHNVCHVGTGTVEHTIDSVGLTSPIQYSVPRRSTVMQINEIDGDEYYRVMNEFVMDDPSIKNVPLTEVGVSRGKNTPMMAGQLIKDKNGAQTTVTLSDEEELIIRYSINFLKYENTHLVLGTGVHTVGGVEYPYQVKINKSFQHGDGILYRPFNFYNEMYINNVAVGVPVPVRVETVSLGSSLMTVGFNLGSGSEYLIQSMGYVCNYRDPNTQTVLIEFTGPPLPKQHNDTLVLNFSYEVKWR